MTAIAIGAGAAVLGTGLSLYQGLHKEHQANQIQKGLKDPTYNIPPEFYQNREIAKQMAQQGLPQEVINNQTNAINQNQAAAIAALNRSANPGTNVASVVRQGNAAMGNLNAEDAQARQNNQRYFIQQNSALGGQDLAKQQSDVFDKYTREFNQMQAYRGAGQQDVMGATNDAIQLGGLAANYASQNPGQTTGQKLDTTLSTTNPILMRGISQYGLSPNQALIPQYNPYPQYGT